MQPTADAWNADIEITVERARCSIAKHFPELGSRSLEPLGEGWDNAAFVVDGAYVFRFPRRKVAVALIERETRLLPQIAPRLPLPIPVPHFVAGPSGEYPYPFAGYAMLEGTPLSTSTPDAKAYVSLASSLGAFLRALHDVDSVPLIAAGLGADELRRFDHAALRPKALHRLRELHAKGFVPNAGALADYLDAVAPSGAREEALAVVHGDLYARHILLDADSRASAIIDWGDMHWGDVAIDLSAAYAVLPPDARSAFFAAYGAIDERTEAMARYRAIYASALLAHYGSRIGAADLLEAGLRGFRYAAP